MKKIVVMQGIPGSGKSTWAQAEAQRTGGLVVSADHWFERSGSYVFDVRELGKAHAACFRAYLERLLEWRERANGTLLVDNTNTTPAEIAPYFLAASALAPEAEIYLLRVTCPPEVAAARCVHGVPERVVHAMYDRMLAKTGEYLPTWRVRRLEVTT